jgi:AAA domain
MPAATGEGGGLMDVSETYFQPKPIEDVPIPAPAPNGDKVVPFPEMATKPALEVAKHSWQALDILDYLDNPPAPPAIGRLLYPGMRHVISGEAEAGKSWLLLVLAAEEIAGGRGVIWVDTDSMGPSAIVERLQQLSLDRESIASRFKYVRPSEGLDTESRTYLLELASEIQARMVVFDSFNATLALHGLDPSSTTDVERFWRTTDPLAEAQVAVAVLDHVVKNPEARGKYAYGSERKHSGAEVHLGMATMEHIVRGKTGRSRLTVHKDRAGYHRDNPPGVFRLSSDPVTSLPGNDLRPERFCWACSAPLQGVVYVTPTGGFR